MSNRTTTIYTLAGTTLLPFLALAYIFLTFPTSAGTAEHQSLSLPSNASSGPSVSGSPLLIAATVNKESCNIYHSQTDSSCACEYSSGCSGTGFITYEYWTCGSDMVGVYYCNNSYSNYCGQIWECDTDWYWHNIFEQLIVIVACAGSCVGCATPALTWSCYGCISCLAMYSAYTDWCYYIESCDKDTGSVQWMGGNCDCAPFIALVTPCYDECRLS